MSFSEPLLNPLTANVTYYVETSQLICIAPIPPFPKINEPTSKNS